MISISSGKNVFTWKFLLYQIFYAHIILMAIDIHTPTVIDESTDQVQNGQCFISVVDKLKCADKDAWHRKEPCRQNGCVNTSILKRENQTKR
ncbi:hypothetical protein JV33_06255 [Pectobacterium carotovorum subsp. carotovorum]|nr:hypothetical protein JV33_06255 [Pectobacterium carotovorum subsp. carotovorum]KML69191.1 hypothetical protein G032_09545 [Pectobacterium carotovorum subsp. carotovorum ICMP 5702]